MSVLPPFSHSRPETVEAALEMISEDAVPYAGGTELLLAMKAGLLRPDSLIDVKRIERMHMIRSDGDPIILGGSVTHHAARHDRGLRSSIPVLSEVLGRVGNPRVRAVGTLGGNLCFAEPKSDVATMLIALGAHVTLLSTDGSRTLNVEDFVVGPYTTARDDREILTEISIPLDRTRAVYMKYQTMDRPTVGVAASLGPNGDLRLVVGAVAGAPHLFTADSPGAIRPEEVAATVDVIPDMTGSERYKRHVTRLYVERALAALETT